MKTDTVTIDRRTLESWLERIDRADMVTDVFMHAVELGVQERVTQKQMKAVLESICEPLVEVSYQMRQELGLEEKDD